ncbi:MAG: hypothetical protein EBR79_02410, partial [Proteobacteria bacterium]|nr:hypothetical protein [Pseudomonadota bacterium]
MTGNNQLNIGNLVYATGVATGAAASAGNVGIGTAAPQTRLEVAGTISATGVSVTGIVSATRFIGDGSGLTGISGADNLGNHTATQALNLAGFNLTNGGIITGTTVSGTFMYGNAASFTTLTVGGIAITGSGGATNRISTTNVSSGAGLAAVQADVGTISFTTGGVAGTAYLDTTGRYIGPGISTTGVISATGVYAGTSLQLLSPTTPTTCNSTSAGTVRYNSPTTTLELCTGSGWQPMGVGIPAGTISAFASTTCPTGWSEYTAARGRFLRGIDNGAGNDPSGTRSPGNTQADAYQAHTHNFAGGSNAIGTGTVAPGGQSGNAFLFDAAAIMASGTGNTSTETRPKNVAVIFCQFNGTSNGWNNPLSGGGGATPAGSTNDVQFNSSGALAADTGNFTYASGILRAPTVSGTFMYGNAASFTTLTAGPSTLSSIGTGAIAMTGNLTGSPLISTSMGGVVSGTYLNARFISGTTITGSFAGDGSGLTNLSVSGDRISSGTTNITTNSATSTISFTTAGTQRMVIQSSGNVGIGTATPAAQLSVAGNVSVTGMVNLGTTGQACTSTISGSLRYSTTSSTVEYCNSTAWTSLGPSSTSPVSFMVTRNGVAQTVADSTWTKLQFTTEVFDTNNNFDNATNYRFTPTIAGKYLINLHILCTAGACYGGIYKNGVLASQNTNGGYATNSLLVDMNGSTDYIEGYVYDSGGTNIHGGSSLTYMSGVLLGPQSGGGGSATPAGSSNDVQFNSSGALAADTGNFTYASGI